MKHVYLPTVQCPCCKMYYVVRCSHAESASESDDVTIRLSSNEYFEVRIVDEIPHE